MTTASSSILEPDLPSSIFNEHSDYQEVSASAFSVRHFLDEHESIYSDDDKSSCSFQLTASAMPLLESNSSEEETVMKLQRKRDAKVKMYCRLPSIGVLEKESDSQISVVRKCTVNRMERLDDRMNFQHLKRLERVFKLNSTKEGNGLSECEFCEALSRILECSGDEEEVKLLFMKIDTSMKGMIDWNDYLSYMQMEYQEKELMATLSGEIPFPKPMKTVHSTHRDTIVAIRFFQLLTSRIGSRAPDKDNLGGRFLVLSKEGQLCIYSLDMELQKSVTITNVYPSLVAIWLTDLVTCPNLNMFAICSTQREITFYELSHTKVERHYQLIGFTDAITCMDYWFDHENVNHATLIVGDTSGTVSVFKFTQLLTHGFFNVPHDMGKLTKVSLQKFHQNKIPGAKLMTFKKIHTSWVNQVRFSQLAQGFDCFLSCSSTNDDSIYLCDLSNLTYTNKYPGFKFSPSHRSHYYRVHKGVRSMDYSGGSNVIVSGGYDGKVRTWSPYNPKSAATVQVHRDTVNYVKVLPAGYLVSIDTGRMMYVTDMRDVTTVQIIRPQNFALLAPPNRSFEGVVYHPRSKMLLIGCNNIGILEKRDDNVKEEPSMVKTHDGTVSKILYNKTFDQVITAGHDSVIAVWDFQTGKKSIQFFAYDNVEVTSMSFDRTERRLITGSRDGRIYMWNFNNGELLKKLSAPTGLEITSIVCVGEEVITAGWNRQIWLFQDPQDTTKPSEGPICWQEVHQEDILSLDYYIHSNGIPIIASSSYDGEIYIWNLENGELLCRLNRLLTLVPISRDLYRCQQLEGKFPTPTTKDEKTKTKIGPAVIRATSSLENTRNIDWYLQSSHQAIRGTEVPDRTESVFSTDQKLLRKSINDLPDIPRELDALRPSAGAIKNDIGRVQHGMIRQVSNPEDVVPHRLAVLTNQTEKEYWKADTSVDNVLFLKKRHHSEETAVLLASGSRGWVHAWSVHPRGGLLGQFVAANKDGDSVLTMTTNESNSIVLTGDSKGYVHIFDIEDYCIEQQQRGRKDGMADLIQLIHKSPMLNDKDYQYLSSKRASRLRTAPPRCIVYLRCHLEPINDICYQERGVFITCTPSGNVRMWTSSGTYVGTLGSKFDCHISQLDQPRDLKLPYDLKRSASANTYFVMTGDKTVIHPKEKKEKTAAKKKSGVILTKEHLSTDKEYLDVVDMLQQSELPHIHTGTPHAKTEKNYERVCKSMAKSCFGKWYQPKRRHRALPKLILSPKSVQIHQALKYSSIAEPGEIQAPDCLKEKWKIQKEANEMRKHRRKQMMTPVVGITTKSSKIKIAKCPSQASSRIQKRESVAFKPMISEVGATL